MDINQIILILVILSLGLMLVNVFKKNPVITVASVLVCLALSWEFLAVIAASDNPTYSNPLWLAVLAEWIFVAGTIIIGVLKAVNGR